jgi:hypothetical protein
MTTTSKSVPRAIATLKLPKVVPALITYAQGIVTAMTNNPSFPAPSPTLAAVQAAITALQAAETAALARTKGAVAVRNAKRAALVALLEQIRAYVQSISDGAPEDGPSIVQGAGLAVRKAPVRSPRTFAAKPGAVSGGVKLVAPSAARRSSYEWQISTDGGKTWLTLPSTLQAKTTVLGLTVASTVMFRYRAVTKTGEGDWSQPTSVLVK